MVSSAGVRLQWVRVDRATALARSRRVFVADRL